jgi:hypothetical protein
LDLLEAVPGPHLIDRGLVGVKGHQVGLLPSHLPVGVIGVDHWRVPNPSPQCWVDLTYPAPGPAQRILGNGPLVRTSPVRVFRTRGTLRTGIPTW